MINYNLTKAVAALISKGKTKDAIEICIKQFDTNQNHIHASYEAILLISSKFSKWESDDLKGLEPAAKILPQINSSIIGWVNNYVADLSRNAETQASIQSVENKSAKSFDENKINVSIKAQIENKAKTDYPTDFQMQKYVIDQQWAAFRSLEKASPDIPLNIFDAIRRKAKGDYPNDYQMQEYMEKQEIEAFQKLQAKNPMDIRIPKDILKIIFQKATSEYPNDFTMQEYIIKQQIQAYQALN
jgi:hypothetical protein